MCFRWSLRVLFLLFACSQIIEAKRSIRKTQGRHAHKSKDHNVLKPIEPYEEHVDENVLEVTLNKANERKRINMKDNIIKEKKIQSYVEEEDSEENLWDVDAFECPSDSCSADLELNKLNRITQIKEKIMKETGVEKSSNISKVVISSNPILQEVISNLNKEHNDMSRGGSTTTNSSHDLSSEDDPDIKIEKMFITAVEGSEEYSNSNGYDILYFNLGKDQTSTVHAAKLHVWLPPTDNAVAKYSALISILQVIEPSTPQKYPRLRNVYSDHLVSYNATGEWVFMDVFSLVREWYLMPENNSGFVLNISTVDGMKIEVDSPSVDPSHAPLLEADLIEKRNDRRKRNTPIRKCENNRVKKYCCLYPLIISFLELEFDFVVAPKYFEANYCRGECPFLFAHKYPHSTILQQIFKNTKTNVGRCCGARDLAPLTMLYQVGNKIQLTTLNDMVVKKCSCN